LSVIVRVTIVYMYIRTVVKRKSDS